MLGLPAGTLESRSLVQEFAGPACGACGAGILEAAVLGICPEIPGPGLCGTPKPALVPDICGICNAGIPESEPASVEVGICRACETGIPEPALMAGGTCEACETGISLLALMAGPGICDTCDAAAAGTPAPVAEILIGLVQESAPARLAEPANQEH